MDTGQLQNFLTILRCGSISVAAEELGIAQPSLSQQVRRLEDQIGASLLTRTSRGVTPTDAGRIFQEHARIILNAFQQAREEVLRCEGVPRGVVALTLPSSICQLLAVPLLIGSREQFPEITIRILEVLGSEVPRSLENGRADLAVMFYAEMYRHFSVRPVAHEELLLVGPAGRFGPADEHGIAVDAVPAEILNGLPLIMPTQSRGLALFQEQYGDSHAIKARIEMEIDSLPRIRKLVAAKAGYSLLSHMAVRDDLVSGELSAARLRDTRLVRSVSIVRNMRMPVTRASVEVEHLILKLLGDLIGDRTWVTEAHEPELPEMETAATASAAQAVHRFAQ